MGHLDRPCRAKRGQKGKAAKQATRMPVIKQSFSGRLIKLHYKMLSSFISRVLTGSLVPKLTNHLQATMITNIDTDIVTKNSLLDKAPSY
jgi:hypothetical protein